MSMYTTEHRTITVDSRATHFAVMEQIYLLPYLSVLSLILCVKESLIAERL